MTKYILFMVLCLVSFFHFSCGSCGSDSENNNGDNSDKVTLAGSIPLAEQAEIVDYINAGEEVSSIITRSDLTSGGISDADLEGSLSGIMLPKPQVPDSILWNDIVVIATLYETETSAYFKSADTYSYADVVDTDGKFEIDLDRNINKPLVFKVELLTGEESSPTQMLASLSKSVSKPSSWQKSTFDFGDFDFDLDHKRADFSNSESATDGGMVEEIERNFKIVDYIDTGISQEGEMQGSFLDGFDFYFVSTNKPGVMGQNNKVNRIDLSTYEITSANMESFSIFDLLVADPYIYFVESDKIGVIYISGIEDGTLDQSDLISESSDQFGGTNRDFIMKDGNFYFFSPVDNDPANDMAFVEVQTFSLSTDTAGWIFNGISTIQDLSETEPFVRYYGNHFYLAAKYSDIVKTNNEGELIERVALDWESLPPEIVDGTNPRELYGLFVDETNYYVVSNRFFIVSDLLGNIESYIDLKDISAYADVQSKLIADFDPSGMYFRNLERIENLNGEEYFIVTSASTNNININQFVLLIKEE